MQTIISVTGPSCSGKSTFVSYLDNHGIPEIKSFTTRNPRSGENVLGSEAYDFVSRDWVESLVQDDIVEKIEFNGNVYGVTTQQLRKAFRRSKGVVSVVIEPEGVKQYAKSAERLGYRLFSIYLDTPKETLAKRFLSRIERAPFAQWEYEFQRMRNMLDIEQPTWASAYDYDLVVPNMSNESSMGSGTTREMLYGYIKLALSPTSAVG